MAFQFSQARKLDAYYRDMISRVARAQEVLKPVKITARGTDGILRIRLLDGQCDFNDINQPITNTPGSSGFTGHSPLPNVDNFTAFAIPVDPSKAIPIFSEMTPRILPVPSTDLDIVVTGFNFITSSVASIVFLFDNLEKNTFVTVTSFDVISNEQIDLVVNVDEDCPLFENSPIKFIYG